MNSQVSLTTVAVGSTILGAFILGSVLGAVYLNSKLDGPKPVVSELNTGGNDELLSEFTARIAQAILADESLRTTTQLRAGIRNAGALLRATEDLPVLPDSDGNGVSDFDEELDRRLQKAVGLENRNLTPEVREAVASVFKEISEEL